MIFKKNESLKHYGTPHNGPIPHSGRYEYGSGKEPFQDSDDYAPMITFQDEEKKLRDKGITSETEIAELLSKKFGMKISSGDLRDLKAADKQRKLAYDIHYATKLMDKGYAIETIAAKMDLSVPTVKKYLDPVKQKDYLQLTETANLLKRELERTGLPIDIGEGVNNRLSCSPEYLNKAVRILRNEGYNYIRAKIPQLTTGNETQGVFLYFPNNGKTTSEIVAEVREKIKNNEYAIPGCNIKENDNGVQIRESLNKPVSLDSKRMMIKYGEDGGDLKEGVIELRRGVGDLSMEGKNYAQVRILVDNKYYLKGMAVYADDLPDGIDVRFNTYKTKDVPLDKILKEVKPVTYETGDPTAILGSYISRQNFYTDKDGKQKQGVLNIVNQQGDSWSNYDNTLASQFLSKQKDSVAKKQLDISLDDKKRQFEEIKSLTNPIVREHYLNEFAKECDKDAESLKAAAFPRQSWNVILPITSLKDNEVFAPQYRDGEVLKLVRYPHGGTFEIPTVIVNNKNKEGRRVIGLTDDKGRIVNDAIGINIKVAEQLSGADFDGDTVIAIPDNKGLISSRSALPELKNFNNKRDYPGYPGMKKLEGRLQQKEMGVVSNLITDMTLLGASPSEVARAVKHSMVVIDASKHNLNYQQSYVDNAINALKKKWQVQIDENGKVIPNKHGAATLISRAKNEMRVLETKKYYKVDEEGNLYSLVRDEKGKILLDKKGNPVRDYERLTGATKNKVANKVKTYNEDNWPPKNINLDEKFANGTKKYKVQEVIDKNGNKKYKVTSKEYVYEKDSNGNFIYKKDEDGNIIKDKNGQPMKVIAQEPVKVTTSQMRATNDANKLISYYDTKIEHAYADYANGLKKLAKDSRVLANNSSGYKFSQSAANTYANEVESLKKKLNVAYTFKPLERKANALAGTYFKQMQNEDANLLNEPDKKALNIALGRARATIAKSFGGADKIKASKRIEITDKEWDAMQAGAISAQMFKNILNNTDKDSLRQRAMPKQTIGMTSSEVARAKRLLSQGYTGAEVADHLGISVSKLNKYLKEG